jgi:nitrate reductase delta subunit
MKMDLFSTRFQALADLLEYPAGGFEARLAAAGRVFDESGEGAPASALLRQFGSACLALSPGEREELYTGTFDVTPACVPYVSIHLFGEENFKRGEFMAGLQGRYQQTGFHVPGELPDHLSVVLRYAAQAEDGERRELLEFCLLGPVDKMIASLSEANPYRALLAVVSETLRAAYPGLEPAPSPLDQMRQHGVACTSLNAGCGCEAVGLHDGPNDDLDPAPAGARIATI